MPYSPREIMSKAWVEARRAARMFGGRAAQYLRETLRQAWFAARPAAVRAAIMNARVLAEVAKIVEEAKAWPALIPHARPRLVADAWEARQIARFRQEDDAPALRLAA